MKKFFSLILVVAMLAGVSCTTDVTEDLAIGIGGKTELTVSLEGSRIALGDKVGGEYQALWSEGDKISINGVVSEEAAISADNPAKASFSFEGTLATPYNIVYPAAAAGKVVFASEQSFVNGTFSEGATPMYGYSESASGVTLHHLAGVLKIGVTGSATLTYAQVSTIDRAPIAGVFDIDCSTGEVTATESATEVVSYSFGEGLALSGDAQYIHLAVPAGVYNELYVTLFDNEGGVMYATVKATDEKPLNAGAVREFTNAITYEATDAVFVIKDVASLQAFAEAAPTLEKDALFVKDIDMTGEAWTPIEGYTKTVRGNGYAIKGLTAPLFGTTSASIKGLHLRDVVLNSNGATKMGAFACTLTATADVTPTISNCSASGTLSVANTELALSATTDLTYGGLVGSLKGAIVENSVNKVAVSVGVAAASGAANIMVGGIAGMLYPYDKKYASINGSTNEAAISQTDSTFGVKIVAVGGILGYSQQANDGVAINYNTNKGAISAKPVASGAVYLAGIAGHIYKDKSLVEVSGVGNNNSGSITFAAGGVANSDLTVGGIFGHGRCTVDDSQNDGAITLEAGSSATILYAGGITGVAQRFDGSNNTNISYSKNNAPITIAANSIDGKGNGNTFIGGIVGWGQGYLDNLENTAKGVITYSGQLNTNGKRATNSSPRNGTYSIGGICAYKTYGNTTNCANHGDIIFSGSITEVHASVISQVRMAGVAGYTANKGENITSDGAIKFTGTAGCEIHIGGLMGAPYSEISKAGDETYKQSDAKIEVSGTISNGLVIGGVIAQSYNTMDDLYFKGSIKITESANISGYTCIGGCIGASFGTTSGSNKTPSDATCNNLLNEGSITIDGALNGKSYIAGCLGYGYMVDDATAVHKFADLTNRGAITVNSSASAAEAMHLAGCTTNINGTISNATNSGQIKFYGTANKGLTCSGVSITAEKLMSNCVNGAENSDTQGAIIVDSENCKSTVNISGVAYRTNSGSESSTNYGNISLRGKTGATIYIGGVISTGSSVSAGVTHTNSSNYGDITIDAQIGTTGSHNCFIGGFAYRNNSPFTLVNCHNYGKITTTAATRVGNSMRIGGIFGTTESDCAVTFDGCSNTGALDINGQCGIGTGTTGYCHVGGIVGNAAKGAIKVLNGISNSGAISCGVVVETQAKPIRIGGLFGSFTGAAIDAESAGEMYNMGEITFTGKSKEHLDIGGIAGQLTKSLTLNARNSGRITCTGSFGADADHAAYIGGIAGKTTVAIDGAQCVATITGIGYTGVGMITGVARSESTLATNCKVAGMIAFEQDDNGDSNWVILKADNYYDYIYGSGKDTDWGESSNYDGCTFISEL